MKLQQKSTNIDSFRKFMTERNSPADTINLKIYCNNMNRHLKSIIDEIEKEENIVRSNEYLREKRGAILGLTLGTGIFATYNLLDQEESTRKNADMNLEHQIQITYDTMLTHIERENEARQITTSILNNFKVDLFKLEDYQKLIKEQFKKN